MAFEEVDAMSDKVLQVELIQRYADLQRILTAPNMKKEVEYQLMAVKAKLEMFGTKTDDLDIHILSGNEEIGMTDAQYKGMLVDQKKTLMSIRKLAVEAGNDAIIEKIDEELAIIEMKLEF